MDVPAKLESTNISWLILINHHAWQLGKKLKTPKKKCNKIV